MDQILQLQHELSAHPVYKTLSNLNSIRHFMRHHVFAVWDFMSLLKSLQKEITYVAVPWKPSKYPPEMVRLLNQIVLGEESDIDQFGIPTSHFELYLEAMKEVGASTAEISNFLSTMDMNRVPIGAREFVKYNINLALQGHVVEVAASFFYGREKLIPSMFESIVSVLKTENINAPTFLYYLERHIEVDSGEHGPLAMKCLNYLTGNDEQLKELALKAGVDSLKFRTKLWDNVVELA